MDTYAQVSWNANDAREALLRAYTWDKDIDADSPEYAAINDGITDEECNALLAVCERSMQDAMVERGWDILNDGAMEAVLAP